MAVQFDQLLTASGQDEKCQFFSSTSHRVSEGKRIQTITLRDKVAPFDKFQQ
jgi:hypothetical protein